MERMRSEKNGAKNIEREGVGVLQSGGMEREPAAVRRWLPVVAQVWMTAVLLLFFVVRIFGSNTFQKLMSNWRTR